MELDLHIFRLVSISSVLDDFLLATSNFSRSGSTTEHMQDMQLPLGHKGMLLMEHVRMVRPIACLFVCLFFFFFKE